MVKIRVASKEGHSTLELLQEEAIQYAEDKNAEGYIFVDIGNQTLVIPQDINEHDAVEQVFANYAGG